MILGILERERIVLGSAYEKRRAKGRKQRL